MTNIIIPGVQSHVVLAPGDVRPRLCVHQAAQHRPLARPALHHPLHRPHVGRIQHVQVNLQYYGVLLFFGNSFALTYPVGCWLAYPVCCPAHVDPTGGPCDPVQGEDTPLTHEEA